MITTEELQNLYSLLYDNQSRLAAERLVIKCGVRADVKGFNYLIDAVILFGKDYSTNVKSIYSAIADTHGAEPLSISNQIAFAIAQSFNLSDNLSRLVGMAIPSSDIHAKLVIAYLGRLFRNPLLENEVST